MNLTTNNRIQCLDKGYVLLIDSLPGHVPSGKTCEYRIAQAARISFDNWNATKTNKDDIALVRYLYENNHTSPLEMVEFMFEIYCPQFVATHFHRHRTANINEQSQRYTEINDDMYLPSTDIRIQSKSNKQGSEYDESFEKQMYSTMKDMEQVVAEQILPRYHNLVDKGVAKEIARTYLPRSCYTKMVYKMDANNLLKLLSLRCAPDAQKETRVYANAMKELVRPLIPTLINCLESRLGSLFLDPSEIKSLSTGIIDPNISSSIRRTNEYMKKFHSIRRRKLFIMVGYRKTGKDTLTDALINNPSKIKQLYPLSLFPLPECINGRRIALADAVKEEVLNSNTDLYIREVLQDESQKDAKIIQTGNTLSSPRDLWIEHAMNMRKQDPNYWLNIVLQKITDDTDHDIIISDCRFPNEVDALTSLPNIEAVTIRIFRSVVPIPPVFPKDDSEHALDDYVTDYLITDNIISLADALELFPQYQHC